MYSSESSQPASLPDVLAYHHAGVIRRYQQEHQASVQEAEQVFQEMLKWLYLCYRASAQGDNAFDCAISPELEKIDWMWHTFLLFTRDYAEFCARHFGLFIHHIPNEVEGEGVTEGNLADALERQYGLVYDVLGEETLTAWYGECLYAVPA